MGVYIIILSTFCESENAHNKILEKFRYYYKQGPCLHLNVEASILKKVKEMMMMMIIFTCRSFESLWYANMPWESSRRFYRMHP